MGGAWVETGNTVRWYSERKCEHCHKVFKASRDDAKFCGVNCRKANQRKVKNVEKLGREIINLQEQLKRLTASDDDRVKWAAQKQLIKIKDNIAQL